MPGQTNSDGPENVGHAEVQKLAEKFEDLNQPPDSLRGNQNSKGT